MRHLKPKTLSALRREGDVWECPGCGADNIYSIAYVEQVLHGRGLSTLLEKNRVKAVDVEASKLGAPDGHAGRASGEDVTLFRDGDIWKEHVGFLSREEEW